MKQGAARIMCDLLLMLFASPRIGELLPLGSCEVDFIIPYPIPLPVVVSAFPAKPQKSSEAEVGTFDQRILFSFAKVSKNYLVKSQVNTSNIFRQKQTKVNILNFFLCNICPLITTLFLCQMYVFLFVVRYY